MKHKCNNLLFRRVIVTLDSSENPVIRCYVVHITTPVVDVIWPAALSWTKSGRCAAVEAPLSILHLITVYTFHSRQDFVAYYSCVFALGVRVNLFTIFTPGTPAALEHCSWNNPFTLPHPAMVSLTVTVHTLHSVQGFTLACVAHDIEGIIPVILVCC